MSESANAKPGAGRGTGSSSRKGAQESKVWFITGISRGLGRELASAALGRGDRVIGTTRDGKSDLAEGNPVAAERLRVFALDVTRAAEVAAVVNEAWQAYGRVDVVVNNAGFGLLGAVEEVEEAQARELFETNFFGLLRVTQAALPHLRAQGSGHLMNISSVGGLVAFPGFALYNASKFAVEGLSEALAGELGPLGIHLTIVEPGSFRTDFLKGESLRRAPRVIEAYAASSGKARDAAEIRNGRQPGDPALAAKAILAASDAAEPPLRLILGADAAAAVETKLGQVRGALEAWKARSTGTEFAAAAAK
jgi:NAD(P)-dependent dehydrogenase (short-subunit alcohol dehydrogenase family)